jgi:hypothetical protein
MRAEPKAASEHRSERTWTCVSEEPQEANARIGRMAAAVNRGGG